MVFLIKSMVTHDPTTSQHYFLMYQFKKKNIAAKRTVGANIRFYRYFYEFNVLYWYFESNQRKINEKCGKTEYARKRCASCKPFFWIDKSEIRKEKNAAVRNALLILFRRIFTVYFQRFASTLRPRCAHVAPTLCPRCAHVAHMLHTCCAHVAVRLWSNHLFGRHAVYIYI